MVHEVDVEVAVEIESVVAVERVFFLGDIIMIGAACCAETCVVVGSDGEAVEDDDVVGEEEVEFINEVVEVVWDVLAFEMSVERACVDACVGASAANDADFFVKTEAETVFEGLLH